MCTVRYVSKALLIIIIMFAMQVYAVHAKHAVDEVVIIIITINVQTSILSNIVQVVVL